MEKIPQETRPTHQVDVTRRRLTKAGLAVPAVLGTLASRPVLGATIPWKCTISGQVSGNMSGHVMESCTTLGNTQSYWANIYSCKNQCGTGPSQTTLISQVFSNLTASYLYAKTSAGVTIIYSSNIPGAKVASIYEILSGTPNSGDSNALYGQKALVILLNAKDLTDISTYPVTQSQAEKLFIAAATGSGYSDTNPTVTWNALEVRDYIDLLWRA